MERKRSRQDQVLCRGLQQNETKVVIFLSSITSSFRILDYLDRRRDAFRPWSHSSCKSQNSLLRRLRRPSIRDLGTKLDLHQEMC